MKYPTIGYRLPHFIASRLFGDRERFGQEIQPEDSHWREWTETYLSFYDSTQKQSSIGSRVNNAGYCILEHLSLEGLHVLEIGPGDLNHINYWQGTPKHFAMVDVQQSMLDRATIKLTEEGVEHTAVLVDYNDDGVLPFDTEKFDLILSFYSLEHLYPLSRYLDDMLRVLKTGGKFVGAISCEGGLAWGIGRYLTSRRWFLKNTTIDPDKIICWEHPYFADFILTQLD